MLSGKYGRTQKNHGNSHLSARVPQHFSLSDHSTRYSIQQLEDDFEISTAL